MALDEKDASTPPQPGAKSPLPGGHDAAAEPSGYKGDNPATAGPGKTQVESETPEGRRGQINPSPEDTNVTPGEARDGVTEIE